MFCGGFGWRFLQVVSWFLKAGFGFPKQPGTGFTVLFPGSQVMSGGRHALEDTGIAVGQRFLGQKGPQSRCKTPSHWHLMSKPWLVRCFLLPGILLHHEHAFGLLAESTMGTRPRVRASAFSTPHI